MSKRFHTQHEERYTGFPDDSKTNKCNAIESEKGINCLTLCEQRLDNSQTVHDKLQHPWYIPNSNQIITNFSHMDTATAEDSMLQHARLEEVRFTAQETQ